MDHPVHTFRSLTEPHRLLGRLTTALLILVSLVTAVITGLYGWAAIMLAGNADSAPPDIWWAVLDPVGTFGELSLAAAGGAFLLWVYGTVRSVSKSGRGPTLMSPAFAVFFTLSLLPYSVIRDLHSRLAPDDRSLGGHLVGIWWAGWVTMLVLTLVSVWIVNADPEIAIEPVLLAAVSCAWGLAITATAALTGWVVRVISDAEVRMTRLGSEGNSPALGVEGLSSSPVEL